MKVLVFLIFLILTGNVISQVLNIDFVGASFVQFPINSHFTTPRWFFDSNLFFTVNKHLEFTIHYDHNLDSYRPLPIENYYYSVSTGVNIKF